MITQSVCPTCGHPIPPTPVAAALVGKQRQLFEIVQSAGVVGITSMAILRRLYADDPSGGPESPNIISVMVRIINQKIRKFGLKINGQRGSGGFYRLVITLDGERK